jgi:hypothetical protein
MTKTLRDGAPFFFATQKLLTASAIDQDIYLTVSAEVPSFLGQVETIDIIPSIDFARDRSPNSQALLRWRPGKRGIKPPSLTRPCRTPPKSLEARDDCLRPSTRSRAARRSPEQGLVPVRFRGTAAQRRRDRSAER